MNYKAHKIEARRTFSKKKLLLVRCVKQKFIRSLSPKAFRKRGPHTDCALLTKFLCQGDLRIVTTLLNYGCNVTTGDEEDFSETPFFHALRLGQTKIVEQILKNSGANTKYLNLSVTKLGRMEGYNALHTAVAMGNKEIIQILLNMNHKLINGKDKDGLTPLHLAWYFWIIQQQSQEIEEIIDLILAAHDEDIHNSTTDKNLSHFHIACIRGNTDIVRGFLDRGVEDINAEVDLDEAHLGGCTALYVAVKYNCKDVVQILLERGATVNTPCKQKKTALFAAAHWKYSKCYALIRDLVLTGEVDAQTWEANCQDQLAIIEMIANHNGQLRMENYWWYSIINLCWENKYLSFWKSTCDTGFNLGSGPMNRISLNNVSMNYVDRHVKKDFFARRKKIILKLIDSGIDLSEKDVAGKTLFHYLVAEKRRGNIKLLQSLIRRNADVTAKVNINDERTILDVAIKHGQINMVRMLIKSKIQWYGPDEKSIRSPLINALSLYTWSPKEYGAIVDLLIKNGTNVNVSDMHGNTPLHVATTLCDDRIIHTLLNAGSHINVHNEFGYTVFMALIWSRLPSMIGDVAEIDNRQKAVCQVLQHHIIKLTAAGLYVNDLVNKDCRLVTSYWSLEFDEGFRCKCLKEIEELKAITVIGDLRLFDMLKRTNKMVRCVDNFTLKTIMRGIEKEQRFPIYGALLQIHYKKCIERLPVFKKAEKLLADLMYGILPTECIGLILENFKIEELNFFSYPNLVRTE